MTYQEFKENVTTVIQNRLGSNVKVTIQEIIKNNDTHYDGLTILSNQLNISPTIYLNFYFKQYLKGRSLEEICMIFYLFMRRTSRPEISISPFLQTMSR